MIAAYYGMSDVFDNLVISLCKFTTLLSAHEVSIFRNLSVDLAEGACNEKLKHRETFVIIQLKKLHWIKFGNIFIITKKRQIISDFMGVPY